MGYSCTVKADDTLRMTLNNANGISINDYYPSNTWENNGHKYFYERGREQTDGSITGQIFRFTQGNYAVKIGSLKILANGKVSRWPGMPKSKIVEVKPMFQII